MSLRINQLPIHWDSSESHYFFYPTHPQAQKWKNLAKKLPFLPGHIYLFTSGLQKICLLSKEAFYLSALSANKHLKCHPKDTWMLSLPLFHVGGLSILARSFCGGFSWKQSSPWNPKIWREELFQKKVTLSSLVPAQVYDLVKNNLSAPKKIRGLIVGGESLSPFLYKKAREFRLAAFTLLRFNRALFPSGNSRNKFFGRNSFPTIKNFISCENPREKR